MHWAMSALASWQWLQIQSRYQVDGGLGVRATREQRTDWLRLSQKGLKQKRLSQLSDAHRQLSWPSVWTHTNYWRSGKNLTAQALDRTGSWPGNGSSSMDSQRAEAEVSESQYVCAADHCSGRHTKTLEGKPS